MANNYVFFDVNKNAKKNIYAYPNFYHHASKHLPQITVAINNKM